MTMNTTDRQVTRQQRAGEHEQAQRQRDHRRDRRDRRHHRCHRPALAQAAAGEQVRGPQAQRAADPGDADPGELAVGGAKNNTIARPTSEISPNASAPRRSRSLNSQAPSGTTSSGVSAPVNSAEATVVLVTPVKKNVMLSPNAMPGQERRLQVGPAQEALLGEPQDAHQMNEHSSIRQNATATPGVSDSFTSVEPALNSRMTATSAGSRALRPCGLRMTGEGSRSGPSCTRATLADEPPAALRPQPHVTHR
jgi:hypothetical protein